MATEDFRNHVYDRIHHLSHEVAKATAPTNPLRSPSTAKVVADEIKPQICELVVLYELLGRMGPG